MKKRIYLFCLSILLLVCAYKFIVSYGETQSEAVSESVGKWMTSQKEAQYNTKLNSPFDKDKNGIKETIDPESGDITLKLPMLSVDSVNNMSMDADLTYQVSNAGDKDESADENGNSKNIDLTKAELERTVFGAGFGLNLPYVEVRENVGTFVSLPGGGVYKADFKAGAGLEGYTIQDLVFERDQSAAVQGKQSEYRLTYPDGTRYFFADDGKLIEEQDRYNNSIFYRYGNFGELEVVKEISDKSGRKIEFSYDQNEINIKNGKSIFTLYLKDKGVGKRKELEKIKDPEGNITTLVYEEVPLSYTMVEGKGSGINDYHVVKEIRDYTGSSTLYVYEKSKKGTSSGNLEYLRVSERKDIQNGLDYNRQRYQYSGEQDGYPYYREGNLPATYTYGRQVLEDDGTIFSYIYDSKHNLIHKKILANNVLEKEISTVYNQNTKAPILVKNKVFNESGQFIETTEEYEYDRNGNVIRSDQYEDGHKGEQEIKSSYSLAYNLKIEEERKINADTKSTQVYTLDEKSKQPIALTIYENGNKVKHEKYRYDEKGNLIESSTEVSPGNYQTTRFEYEKEFGGANLTAVEYVGVKSADQKQTNIRVEYTYDTDNGLLLSKTDGNGNITRYVYDKNGRVIELIGADGNTEYTQYNDAQNIIITTNKQGNKLKYLYDPLGNLTEVIDLKTDKTLASFFYDNLERKTKSVDGLGNYQVTSYGKLDRVNRYQSYDSEGKLLSQVSFAYDNVVPINGKKTLMLETEQGFNSDIMKTRQYFDSLGNLIKNETIGTSETLEESFTYDYLGQALSFTDREGKTSYKKYDALGNVIKMQNPAGQASFAEYDLQGNMLKSISPEGKETYYTYDNLSRLIKQRRNGDKEAEITLNYYDNNGNLIKQMNPLGEKTEYVYDSMGRNILTRIGNTKAGYQEEIKEYDEVGNLLKESYGLSASKKRGVTYQYDHLGNLLEEKDELGNSAYYSYDIAGNLLSKKDKNGVITSYTYDGLGRALNETNTKDKKAITYSYDGLGRITEVSDSIGKYNFKYDQFSNLIQLRNPLEIYQNYTYDKLGRVTSYVEERSGIRNQKLTYSYDKIGNLIQLNTDIAIMKYGYDKDGKLLEEKNSTTNEVTKYSYDMLDRMVSKNIWQKDKLQTSQKYEYDILGRKTKEIIDGEYKLYFYDSFDRVKEVVEGNKSIQEAYSKGKIINYRYDPYSNIIEKSIWQDFGREKETYTYNQNNQLTSKKVDDKAELYQYDKQGNLVQKKEVLSGGSYFINYQYDSKNRLESVNNNDEISASYTYRYDGLRHSKTVDGETKYFTYNGGNITSELTSQGTYNYYRGMNMIGMKNPKGDKYYFTQNNKGDILTLKDATGSKVDSYRYDPFGNKVEDTEKLNFQGEWEKETSESYNPFGYCGEYQDEETGFVYLRGRYYDPSTARFITEDPTKDNGNWYDYCDNDPVNRIDPSGYKDTTAQMRKYGKDLNKDIKKSTKKVNIKKNAPSKPKSTIKNPKKLTAVKPKIIIKNPRVISNQGLKNYAAKAPTPSIAQQKINAAALGCVPGMSIAGDIMSLKLDITTKDYKYIPQDIAAIVLPQADALKVARIAEGATDASKIVKGGSESSKVLGGSFKEVNATRGADEVGHHVAQDAYNKTIGISRNDGPAVLMTKEDHLLTRTYAGKGRMTMINDVEYTARERMYLDIVDIRNNFGTKYNQGLVDMVDYAKTLPQYSK